MVKKSSEYFGFKNLGEALDKLNVPDESKLALIGILADFLNDEYNWLGDIMNDPSHSTPMRMKATELRFYLREVSRLLKDFREQYEEALKSDE